MILENFIKKLKTAKLTQKRTGYFDVNVKTNSEHTRVTIYKDEACDKCNSVSSKNVIVEFFNPHQLTIFEAEMLYSVYCLNRKPYDYDNFHKSIAGKEFIENIKVVEHEDHDHN